MITTQKKLDDIDKKILQGFAEGLTGKEIAANIFVSYETLKKRIRKMKDIYNCRNITELHKCVTALDSL